jgi:hypothetical protein
MPIIRADLDVLRIPPQTSEVGWAARGTISASFRTLTTTLGRPDFGTDTTEEATLWQIGTPAGRAQLHNWLGGSYFLRRPVTTVTWTIQAPATTVLPWIYKVITGSTAAFPHSVRDLVGDVDRETLTQAYLLYLAQRVRVGDPRHGGMRIEAWRQLVEQAGSALEVLTSMTAAPSSLSQRLQQVAQHATCPANGDHVVHDEFIDTMRALAAAVLPDGPATVRSR